MNLIIRRYMHNKSCVTDINYYMILYSNIDFIIYNEKFKNKVKISKYIINQYKVLNCRIMV